MRDAVDKINPDIPTEAREEAISPMTRYGSFLTTRSWLSVMELKQLLRVASGGIVFTTIQKFFPEEKGDRYPLLSERRNIIVIADEAHRSQYDFIDGFAKHIRDALPKASFIGFTALRKKLFTTPGSVSFSNSLSSQVKSQIKTMS